MRYTDIFVAENGNHIVNEAGLTIDGVMSTLRSMKLLWSVAGLMGCVLAPVDWAQGAPVKGAVYQDHNTVLAMVGSRMVTKWEVMRSLERKQAGFTEKFNRLNLRHGALKKELEAAKLDGRKEQVVQLETLFEKADGFKKANLSTFRSERAKLINDQLLIEQIKSDPLYREPPGLVDYILTRRVKAKKSGLTGVIRDLQNEGRTMAMLREEILDNWILGRINREMSQQVIVSPKQVRDRYQSQYASKAGQQFNVVDLYLMRIDWDNSRAAELQAEVDKMVESIRSRDDFMDLRKQRGAEGDGPQGLIPIGEGDSSTIDRESKGSPLPGTPIISLQPTVERVAILKDAHFKLLMGKVSNQPRGKAGSFRPPFTDKFIFIFFVNDMIRGYTIPLQDQRKKIHAELFAEALREIRRRKLAEARKVVFLVDQLSVAPVASSVLAPAQP